jgi:hypothetical protein
MGSNISLQSVCDYVLTNVRGAPIQDVLGVQNEPALSICNDVYQETLQKPLTWRFNKANSAGTGLGVLYWTTNLYQQDYQLTNANVSPILNPQNVNAGSAGGQVVHLPTVANLGFVANGTTATVTTNWPHGYTVGQKVYFQNVGLWVLGVWTPNATINAAAGFAVATIPSPTTFTIATTVAAANYGARGINDIGWIERAVLEDFANTAQLKPRHSIEVTMNVELESIVQPSFKLSYQYQITDPSTLSSGQLIPSNTAVFRLWPVPSQQIWGVMIDYQMAPTTFNDLGEMWGVWPDPLIFVIRQGVKAAALDFVEDPRAVTEYQLFQTKLDQVREIRDQERPSQTMFPDRPIMYGG